MPDEGLIGFVGKGGKQALRYQPTTYSSRR
jgi:hypothetical protein